MAVTTAFTADNLLALEDAIVKGVRRVKYTDKEVEYRSLEEMLQLRNLMRKELGVGASGAGARLLGKFSKGLC